MKRRSVQMLLVGFTLTVLSTSSPVVGTVQAQVPTAQYGEGPGASGVAGTTTQIQAPEQAVAGVTTRVEPVTAVARALPATGSQAEPDAGGLVWTALVGFALVALGSGLRHLRRRA